MALLPSVGVEWLTVTVVAPPVGRTEGMAATRSAFNRRSFGTADLDIASAATTHTVGSPTSGPGPSSTALPTVAVESKLNVGEDWFEKLHIYPEGPLLNPGYVQDQKVQFGQILAQQDKPYLIHSAFRRTTGEIAGITKSSVSPGIETPDVVVTGTIGPLSGILNPSSTFNVDLVTGLGTQDLVNLRALQDGLPRFDGPVTFSFDIFTTSLETSGSRVAMITSNYEFPYSETMQFLTDIIPASAGKEQRLSVRKQARERFNTVFRLEGVERQRLQSLIFDWHNQTFGLPLFHEQVLSTASTIVGANQWQITGGDETDFRVNGLALVISDAFTFDIVTISAITDTLLTATGTAVFAYPVGTQIMPVRSCRIVSQVKGRLAKFNNLQEFNILFESVDNDTGTPAGSSTDWTSNTYNSKILLDDCNLQGITMRTTMNRNIVVLDNETGAVSQFSAWDSDKRGSSKGFYAQTKQSIQDLKSLLRYVRGRQVSFYLPTFTNDLTVAASLAIGANTVDIENIDYTRFVRDREPMATFKITFTDDTTLIRTITASNDHPSDVTQERLTLDDTWPANRGVSEVVSIQFYELVRFDTDSFRIVYERVGRAKLTAPVLVVFD